MLILFDMRLEMLPICYSFHKLLTYSHCGSVCCRDHEFEKIVEIMLPEWRCQCIYLWSRMFDYVQISHKIALHLARKSYWCVFQIPSF